MLLQDPFEIVTTAVDGRILQVLAGADSWFTIAQVWDLSRVRSRDQVRRVLARLAGTGVLDVEQIATSYRYRLNRDHLGAGPIIDIATIRQRLLQRLRTEFESGNMAPCLVYAALFGSAARGTMRRGSDIDLFVVRSDQLPSGLGEEDWEAAVFELEHKVSRWTGNPANVLHMTESGVIRAGDTAALAEIRHDGVPLFGRSSWLTLALSRAAS
jgi:predicted nucleotidyltransferase